MAQFVEGGLALQYCFRVPKKRFEAIVVSTARFAQFGQLDALLEVGLRELRALDFRRRGRAIRLTRTVGDITQSLPLLVMKVGRGLPFVEVTPAINIKMRVRRLESTIQALRLPEDSFSVNRGSVLLFASGVKRHINQNPNFHCEFVPGSRCDIECEEFAHSLKTHALPIFERNTSLRDIVANWRRNAPFRMREDVCPLVAVAASASIREFEVGELFLQEEISYAERLLSMRPGAASQFRLDRLNSILDRLIVMRDAGGQAGD